MLYPRSAWPGFFLAAQIRTPRGHGCPCFRGPALTNCICCEF
jgi:hypothetical protein